MRLYLHIPFCRRRCVYCDFFSTTGGAETRRRFVRALCAEIAARREESGSRALQSIYFGGGTPSQLDAAEVADIFEAIRRNYTLAPDAEITFEMNPDDAGRDYLAALQRAGVNRVSMGVQTFDDDLLRLLGRRHTASQAVDALRLAADGFGLSVSLDLIYGLPGQTADGWASDVAQALALPVGHLSAYALAYEAGTALWQMRRDGRVSEADEALALGMYDHLIDAATAAGFEHYEISNFALPGRRARHNSAYWAGQPYIGCGPGAHSFDGAVRRANLPDLDAYIARIGTPPCESERLTPAERYNETVMTRLRTADGLPDAVLEACGAQRAAYFRRMAEPHLRAGRLAADAGVYRLTRAGLFTSDDLLADLMEV